MIYVARIQRFPQKGSPPLQTDRVRIRQGRGLEGDRHFAKTQRAISISSLDTQAWIHAQNEEGLCFHRFGANIILNRLPAEFRLPDTEFRIDNVLFRITGQKKSCYPDRCARAQQGQYCYLQHHGLYFAASLSSGVIRTGSEIHLFCPVDHGSATSCIPVCEKSENPPE